jgi:lipopolysaccharide/colanic/teichoic acid biosynthesis glycosyltransferase
MYNRIKRAIDFVLCIVALPFLLIAMLAISIAIKLMITDRCFTLQIELDIMERYSKCSNFAP